MAWIGIRFSPIRSLSAQHRSLPWIFAPRIGSGCNSPAVDIPLADPINGRTYDHDHVIAGAPTIGALRADHAPNQPAVFTQMCNSHCFQHPFAVPNGVYLVRLKFSSGALSGQRHDFAFVLNSRKVAAGLDPSEATGPDDSLVQYFLVRPGGASIVLEPDASTDSSVVTEVDITPFDTVHGDGPQVIPW